MGFLPANFRKREQNYDRNYQFNCPVQGHGKHYLQANYLVK